jgi:hypothetical protein
MADFNGSKFFAKRKFWAIAGQVHLYDESGGLVCYVRQKILKLKEDITVYKDEKMAEPVLSIKARQIIDFSAAYDVVDVLTGEKAGALKRKGWKSLLKDSWILMDAADNEIGTLGEESSGGALASRLINLIPQKYIMRTSGGDTVARFDQQFAIAVHKFDIEFFDSSKPKIDRRLAMGALILLLLIEGRQS